MPTIKLWRVCEAAGREGVWSSPVGTWNVRRSCFRVDSGLSLAATASGVPRPFYLPPVARFLFAAAQRTHLPCTRRAPLPLLDSCPPHLGCLHTATHVNRSAKLALRPPAVNEDGPGARLASVCQMEDCSVGIPRTALSSSGWDSHTGVDARTWSGAKLGRLLAQARLKKIVSVPVSLSCRALSSQPGPSAVSGAVV
jgi:hypothetical protein